jgi:hypothetical protein
MRRRRGDERGARAAFVEAQRLNPLYQTPR